MRVRVVLALAWIFLVPGAAASGASWSLSDPGGDLVLHASLGVTGASVFIPTTPLHKHVDLRSVIILPVNESVVWVQFAPERLNVGSSGGVPTGQLRYELTFRPEGETRFSYSLLAMVSGTESPDGDGTFVALSLSTSLDIRWGTGWSGGSVPGELDPAGLVRVQLSQDALQQLYSSVPVPDNESAPSVLVDFVARSEHRPYYEQPNGYGTFTLVVPQDVAPNTEAAPAFTFPGATPLANNASAPPPATGREAPGLDVGIVPLVLVAAAMLLRRRKT